MTTAKVFMNGRSQAIRLPRAFRVKAGEVYLKKVPEGFLVLERDPWEICRAACRELSSKSLEALKKRRRERPQERDWRGVLE